MPTPNVFFGVKFFLPCQAGSNATKNTKERNFVTCNTKGGNLLSYLTRNEAVDKENIETISVIEKLAEHTETSHKDMLDYARSRPGSTGAFNEKGEIDKEGLDVIKKDLQQTKSIVWTSVLSFEDKYGKQFCPNKKAGMELIQAELKHLFNNSHLKYENINWYAAMHTNTDNRHIHIVFWEKQPIYTKKHSQNYLFADKGKLANKALNDFKFAVARHFEEKRADRYTMRNTLRNGFKSTIRETNYFDAIQELRSEIKQQNRYAFAALPRPLQDQIMAFAFDVIKAKPELQEEHDKYINTLMAQQKKYFDTCKENNIEPSEEVKQFVNTRTRELYLQLGNDVCNTIKQLDKDISPYEKPKSNATKNTQKEDPATQDLVKKAAKHLRYYKAEKSIEHKETIRLAVLAQRTIKGLCNAAVGLLEQRFDNSFNRYQTALNEQKRKKQKEEKEKETVNE